MPIDRYLDYNGSTPIHAQVLEACLLCMTGSFANPSAAHAEGREVRTLIDHARATIAGAIGAKTGEIWFTSGGTESNNWALEGSARVSSGRHLIVSEIEHKSVLATARDLARRGFEVSYLPVDASGAVRMRDVVAALRQDTCLLSVMFANNETGIVQPVKEIGALCRERGIRFHTDAVCALGKLPIDVRSQCCDLMSLTGHKLYAPKGCGVLYVREGVEIAPLIHGCGQQGGLRSGTENALGAVGFARAVELMQRGALYGPHSLENLRDQLWRGIQERFPACRRNGGGASLPNTLNIWFPDCAASDLQSELGRRGFSVATGASGSDSEPSHVLLAMGLGRARARSSLRFSLGCGTTPETIQIVLQALEEILAVRTTSLAGRGER